jgi:hypothetical protein
MAKMKILIIDDSQERHDAFDVEYKGHTIYHAYNYQDAITWIGLHCFNNYCFSLICFDHDLNDFDAEGNEYTGATVARFMANGYGYGPIRCGSARVHSHNVDGAKNIISILRSGGVTDNVYYEPFALIPGCDMKGLKEQANAEGDKEDTSTHT